MGSRSNFCISETIGVTSIKVWECMKLESGSDPGGSEGPKVKVTKGQGQVSVSQIPLGRCLLQMLSYVCDVDLAV